MHLESLHPSVTEGLAGTGAARGESAKLTAMLASEKIAAFIATENPAKAKAFYRDTLGLPSVSEDPFAMTFNANGILLRVTPVQKAVIAPYTVLGWNVNDIATVVQSLTGAGVVFERYTFLEQDPLGIWTAPGGAKVAWFKDPDGNTLSVAQL